MEGLSFASWALDGSLTTEYEKLREDFGKGLLAGQSISAAFGQVSDTLLRNLCPLENGHRYRSALRQRTPVPAFL